MNINEKATILASFVIGMIIGANDACAQNPYIPLQIQPVQIMTPYELSGIESYEQSQLENQYRYEQRLRDLQQYQQQQEIIDQLNNLNRTIERR